LAKNILSYAPHLREFSAWLPDRVIPEQNMSQLQSKTPFEMTARFPSGEASLITNWANLVFQNVYKGYEQSEDLAELKSKVSNLSSGLESLRIEIASCKDCIDKLHLEFVDRPIIKETRLFDISEDLEVLEPIPIVIEETEGEVIASFPELEVFAVATGEAEAVSSLKKAIRELYYELIDIPQEQLGRVPQSWKRVLNKVIGRVGSTRRV
jgi:hypothetical protein